MVRKGKMYDNRSPLSCPKCGRKSLRTHTKYHNNNKKSRSNYCTQCSYRKTTRYVKKGYGWTKVKNF